jgi:hypothetical protein
VALRALPIIGSSFDSVRSGHHCAQPILRHFGTCAEVDLLAATVRRLQQGGR